MTIDPRLQDILYAKSIGQSKEFVYSHPEYRPTPIERLRFWYYLRQAKRNIPLAYIIHEQEFCSLRFKVNRHTLIPRPDTELMVGEVVKILNNSKNSLFIDVGTGSGCIAISALVEVKKNPSTNPQTIAIDLSKKALKVARKNAKLHQVNIKFVQGNLLTPLSDTKLGNFKNIVITANLPYLTSEQFAKEPSIQHEPHEALVADSTNGLSLYKKLLEQATTFPFPTTLLLEIDPGQSSGVKQLASSLFPEALLKIKTDLTGRDRLAIIINSIHSPQSSQ
ncbi:MAG TPA: HemK/PrmC family methyltransferase [Patescibacteria group bacterium]|nr:HemK/PrmC family methyltransferase [Patescibacteria group bacterium]